MDERTAVRGVTGGKVLFCLLVFLVDFVKSANSEKKQACMYSVASGE